MDELQLKQLCNRYKIKYKYFSQTETAIIETGLDEWIIKFQKGKERPFHLLHQNKIKPRKKPIFGFHTQRRLRTLEQAIDCIIQHKGVLSNLKKVK